MKDGKGWNRVRRHCSAKRAVMQTNGWVKTIVAGSENIWTDAEAGLWCTRWSSLVNHRVMEGRGGAVAWLVSTVDAEVRRTRP